MLAHLNAAPHLSGGGGTGLLLHNLDGTHHTAAGTVHLGDPQLHALLDQLGHGRITGQAGLGGRDKHPHALHGHHDAALVFLGYDALHDLLVGTGLLDVLPHLDGVHLLLGQGGVSLHIVDADDEQLHLIAHLHHVLRLHGGIIRQLVHRDIAGLLAAQIHMDFRGGDGRHHAGYLLSCI